MTRRSEMTPEKRAEFAASDAAHIASFEGATRTSEANRIAAEIALEESLPAGEELFYPPNTKALHIVRDGIVRTRRRIGAEPTAETPPRKR